MTDDAEGEARMTDRKAPADFIEEARHLLRDPEAMARAGWMTDPPELGTRERRAYDEARRTVRRTGPAFGPDVRPIEGKPDDDRGLAFMMAVRRAMARRTKPALSCRHARTGSRTPDRPIRMVLSTGHMVCDQCAATMLPDEIEDDGRCDVCDAPTKFFTEMVTSYGVVTIYANVCDACAEFQRALNAGSPERNGHAPAHGWEDVLALQLRLQRALEQRRVVSVGSTSPVGRELPFRVALAAIRAAAPVFVSPDVMAVWDEARHHFDAEPFHLSDPFIPAGFVLLPHAVALAPERLAIGAFVWGPGEGGGVDVFGFSHGLNATTDTPVDIGGRRYTADEAREFIAHQGAFPWQLVAAEKFAYGAADANAGRRAIQAFWRLGQEFVLSRERLSRARRREAQRLGMPRDASEYVTVMRLRRAKTHADHDAGHPVEYSCQWVVRGHWRNQWYPSERRHRQRFIPAYVKGPTDKPLRVTDRVVEFVR